MYDQQILHLAACAKIGTQPEAIDFLKGMDIGVTPLCSL